MEVGIIGGGAAGMMAAITAANNGAKVKVIERLDRVGKKILATGNGRCNMTNRVMGKDFFYGQHHEFVESALNFFDVEMTMDFFGDLGIYYRVDENGKVYPYSNQASSILDVLRYEMERLGVKEVCQAPVVKIKKIKEKFEVTIEDGTLFHFDRVILTTGGKAAPNLGSNGSGYRLATEFGHQLIQTFPALVQLKLEGDFLKGLKGVKFDGAVRLVHKGVESDSKEGEILYTEYGISGPPVIDLSRCASALLQAKEECEIQVDMFPKKSKAQLHEMMHKRFLKMDHKPLDSSFIGLINKKIIPILLKQAGIEEIHKPVSMVKEKEILRIITLLKEWPYKVIATQSWKDAQVTAGGIDVRHISSVNMESNLIKGLYFAGEILDIDGACGGYNLQWAWSSGYLAGLNASL